MFSNLKISYKLNFYISLLLFSAMSITAGITYYVGKQELSNKLEEKLHVVNHLKIERIRSLFSEVDELIGELHNDKDFYTDLERLSIICDIDSLAIEKHHILKKIRSNIEYRDEPSIIRNVKILSLEGKELVNEKHLPPTTYERKISSPTSDFFSKAHNHISYTPVHYENSIDEYVLYSLAPLHDSTNRRVVAIFSIQLHMAPIYNAISDTTGLGNTGETILSTLINRKIHIISPLRTDHKRFLDREFDAASNFAIPAVKSLEKNDGFISKVPDYNSVIVDVAWNHIPELGWGIYSKINHHESFRSIFSLKRQLIIIAITLIVISVFFVFLLTKELLNPIEKIKLNMTKLADGDFPETIFYKNKDELYDTIVSMNHLVKRLKTSTDLALAIGNGDLQKTFNFDKNNDVLSRSLLSMRDSLLLLDEDNSKRKWSAEGITLHADVMRNSSESFEKLSQTIISTLTEYVGAQHGGIYIQYDDFVASLKTENDSNEVYYELVSSYAYDTTDHKTRFKPGQGLVGQCALEKNVIQVKDAELDFSKISSGLGEVISGSMLLVPLVVNEETLGVIELTSFADFKPHVEDFVLKIGENIASSILAAKSSDKTNKLLRQSQAIIKELKLKQKELIEHQSELHMKEQEHIMENDELKAQIEELKRELRSQ